MGNRKLGENEWGLEDNLVGVLTSGAFCRLKVAVVETVVVDRGSGEW